MLHELENHKIFPIIAWVTFIGFAGFVFYLSLELQTAAENLSSYTEQNIKALEIQR